MLFEKLHDRRDASVSSMRFPGDAPDHPALVAGSYIALLLFAVLLHRGALNGNWRLDDPRQLLSVINNPFGRLLFDHDAWMTFTWNAFTPILAGQYWIDLLLFGLNPRGFYWHHLAELAITALFTYHLFCQRIPRHLSLLATLGFLAAMPTFSVMDFLPNRHYLTGLLLSIGSVYMYQRALRDGRSRNLFISAGLFFLAMLAKELYAVFLIYFLLTSWRTQFFRRVCALYLASFSTFAAWRTYMLDSFLGGHHVDHHFIDRFVALNHVHRAIFGSDLVAAIFLACVVILILLYRLFGARHLGVLAAVLVAIYLPLLFATYAFQAGDNYFVLRLSFLPLWLCAAGLAYIAKLLRDAGAGRMACILLLAFFAVTATASARRIGHFRALLDEHDIQVGFMQKAGPQSALFPSASLDSGHDLQLIALSAGHDPAGIIQFRDDVFQGYKSYWEYDAHCRCLVQLSYDRVLEKSSHLDQLNRPRESAPISLLVTWQARNGLAGFIVEPPEESLCMLSVPGMQSGINCSTSSIALASKIPKGKFEWLHAQVARGRQDGLVIFTPYMSVPENGVLQWSRGVFLPQAILPDKTSSTCHIDAPGNRNVLQSHASPLELRGWIRDLSKNRPDPLPLAILASSAGKQYVANLHREQRPDVNNADGLMIGGHVLDADLRRVEPGVYRLLLGVDDITCDTHVAMTIS